MKTLKRRTKIVTDNKYDLTDALRLIDNARAIALHTDDASKSAWYRWFIEVRAMKDELKERGILNDNIDTI